MRNIKKTIALLPLALLVACENPPDPPPSIEHVIPIGALVDNTGSGATLLYGAAATLAAKQMNEGIKAAGGNIRFDMLIRDSRGDATNSQMQALNLINTNKIRGLVADISGVSLAANILNYDPAKGAMGKVAIACYACSSAFFNDPTYTDTDAIRQSATRDTDNWLFRAFFNSKFESLVQARIALSKGAGGKGDVTGEGKFKVAILAQDDAFGQSSTAKMKEAVQALSGIPWASETIFVKPNVDLNTYDWAGDFQKLLDAKGDDKEGAGADTGAPDAVFLAVLPNLAMAAVKAYRESSFTAPLMSTTAFRRAYILQNLQSAANGVEGNSPPLYVDDESGRAFNSAMVAANGEPPEQLCSGTYDSAATLMLAALVAGLPLGNPAEVTTEAVRDAMVKLFDPNGEVIRPTPADFGKAYTALKAGKTINYKGASGVKYDAAGENYPRMVHWTVEGGKFKELESYDCSPTSPNCNRVQ
jgi:ABC-type branched-subunit amino acid transport system substrate-binding protein